jgi:uncharacterized membrane protein YfcA
LEVFTAAAALGGGLIAFALPDRALAILFAGLLGYVALTMARGRTADEGPAGPDTDRPAPRSGGYAESLSGEGYRVRNLGPGVAGSLLAGLVSALFGIGGGIVKVPLMNLVMGVPMRVAAATSNLMIGVTASAGGVVYLLRGGIDPYVAAPLAVGVFAGASTASRLAGRIDLRLLRAVFVVVLVVTAIQMLGRGVL